MARRKKRFKFLRRHRLAIDIIVVFALVASTTYLIVEDTSRQREGVVIGGIKYSFNVWGPTRKLEYSISIRATENIPDLLVYYYVPVSNGLNQRVLSERVMYVMGPSEYTREAKPIDEGSVVVWHITNLPSQGEVRLYHIYQLQTRAFESRPDHIVPRENDVDQWLGNTEAINADENIVTLANQLKVDSAWETAERIYEWVKNNIAYKSTTLSRRPATEVLSTRSGDCDDIAGLVTSLAKVKGIPARVIISTYGLASYIPFHAYAEIYTEYGWVTVDASNANLPVGSLTTEYIKLYA